MAPEGFRASGLGDHRYPRVRLDRDPIGLTLCHA